MSSPQHLAREIALLLQRDAIAARQVKEFIPANELCQLLEIKPDVIFKEITQDAPELIKALQSIDEDELLAYIKGHFKVEEVLAAYRKV